MAATKTTKTTRTLAPPTRTLAPPTKTPKKRIRKRVSDMWFIRRGIRPSSMDPFPSEWVWKRRKAYERRHNIVPEHHPVYLDWWFTRELPSLSILIGASHVSSPRDLTC